jgi:hypothetical protein
MTVDELRLFAAGNFGLNFAAWIVCVCRLNAMTKEVFWWVKFEYAFMAMALVLSALSPYWGEWPQWGQSTLSAAVLVGFLSSYQGWRRGGRDVPPDIVTDHAQL